MSTNRPARDRRGIFHTFAGTLLHLYVPGFHAAGRTRSTPNTAMCGAQAWDSWKAPLSWYDEPPTLGLPYRWCGKCLGIALVHHGHVDTALEAIAPHFTTPTLQEA